MKRKMNCHVDDDTRIAEKLKNLYGMTSEEEESFRCKMVDVLDNLPENEPKKGALCRFCTWIGIRHT